MTLPPIPHPWRGVRPFQRHGLVLMVAGTVFLLIGVTYILADARADRALALQILLIWSPMWLHGITFAVAGLLTIISSRWPPVSKTWGYMVLSGVSAGWALAYLLSMVVPYLLDWLRGMFGDIIPLMPHAPWTGLSAVGAWSLLSFMWVAISGLVNADDIGRGVIIVEDAGEIINPEELM